MSFSSREPGAATALTESADYRNPDDPNAKPPPVRRIAVTYPSGFAIDTSVPARCTASDDELETRGGDACPDESRVGSGGAELATGLPAPFDKFEVDFELFNNAGEIVFVTKARGTGQVVAVSRSKIEGATVTSEIAATPGGPPDGQSSVRHIDFRLDQISVARGGRQVGYLTTPPTCPPSREWTGTGTFTYADGVSQSIGVSTPCQRASTPDLATSQQRHHRRRHTRHRRRRQVLRSVG